MAEMKKRINKNIKIDKNLTSASEVVENQYTGTLVPNDQNTVQPIALMRLGLFVPTLKSTSSRISKKASEINATEELIQLETAKSEGFTDIKITGSRLDMDSDFKTWVGIVRGLADFGDESGRVEMSITQFAKYCGYPSSRLRKTLRDKILGSLRKIMSATVSFQKTLESKNEDGSNKIMMKMVHLLNNVDYNEETNTISFEAEKRLKELYQFDHKVLLQLKVIQKLPRKETAQALYTFIESLPANPVPISLARFRTRLNLGNKSVYSQNQLVRKGLKILEELGYLSYSEVKRGKSVYFSIHNRNPKLKVITEADAIPHDMKVPEQVVQKDQTELAKERLRERIAELAKDPTEANLKLIETIVATIRSL